MAEMKSCAVCRRVVGSLVPSTTPAGVVLGTNEPTTRLQTAQDFISAMGKHRHWGRALVEQVPA